MDIFVARQPIFDVKKHVYAYELLYRAGEQNQSNVIDGIRPLPVSWQTPSCLWVWSRSPKVALHSSILHVP